MEPEGDESLREALILRIDEADVEDAEVLGNGDLHPKIRVRDLRRKSEEGTTLLSGVSVDIWKGTVVGVIGPSGSGKSTFLRALNRLWEPSADSVFLDYNDITKIDVMTLRRRVGMLFQTPALFEGSVAENIRFGPALRGEKLSDEEVVKYLGLADLDSSLASRSVSGLSVGQAQRVALARTLANEPEVLLLDEPTSALDPISTQHIEESIVKLRKNKGMTIIMVSHSVKQIQRIADVVFLLVGGQIVETLKPDQLSNANHPMARTFLECRLNLAVPRRRRWCPLYSQRRGLWFLQAAVVAEGVAISPKRRATDFLAVGSIWGFAAEGHTVPYFVPLRALFRGYAGVHGSIQA